MDSSPLEAAMEQSKRSLHYVIPKMQDIRRLRLEGLVVSNNNVESDQEISGNNMCDNFGSNLHDENIFSTQRDPFSDSDNENVEGDRESNHTTFHADNTASFDSSINSPLLSFGTLQLNTSKVSADSMKFDQQSQLLKDLPHPKDDVDRKQSHNPRKQVSNSRHIGSDCRVETEPPEIPDQEFTVGFAAHLEKGQSKIDEGHFWPVELIAAPCDNLTMKLDEKQMDFTEPICTTPLLYDVGEAEEKALYANAYKWLFAPPSEQEDLTIERRKQLLQHDAVRALPRFHQEWVDLQRFRDMLLRSSLEAHSVPSKPLDDKQQCQQCKRDGRYTQFTTLHSRSECCNCEMSMCKSCCSNEVNIPCGLSKALVCDNCHVHMQQLKQPSFCVRLKQRQGNESVFYLAQLPISLWQMHTITELSIQNSKLNTLPAELGLLSNLQILDVSNNTLRNLPDEIGKLLLLYRLIASDNFLTVLPSTLSALPSFKELHVATNQLLQIPSWLSKCTQLQILDISNNPSIRRETHMHIAASARIKILRARNINMCKLPKALFTRALIEELDVSYNAITKIPITLACLRRLRYLKIAHNFIRVIPNSIHLLENLEFFHSGGNRGLVVPDSIGALLQLKQLILYRCSLEKIPDTVGSLHSLRVLDLRDNRLAQLPETILHLRHLRDLHLEGNYHTPRKSSQCDHIPASDNANVNSLATCEKSKTTCEQSQPHTSCNNYIEDLSEDKIADILRPYIIQKGKTPLISAQLACPVEKIAVPHSMMVVVWKAISDLDLTWLIDRLTGPVCLPKLRDNIPHLSALYQAQEMDILQAEESVTLESNCEDKEATHLFFKTHASTVAPTAIPDLCQNDLSLFSDRSLEMADEASWPQNMRMTIIHHKGSFCDAIQQRLCHIFPAKYRIHLLCVDLSLSHVELLTSDTQNLLNTIMSTFPDDRIQLVGIKPVLMKSHIAATKQVKIWDAAQSLLFSRRRAITNECARLPLSLRQHPGFESRAAARSYRMFSLCEDRTQHSSAPTDVQNTYGARLQYWREQNINIGRTCLAVSRWDCRQLWDILKQEAIAISAKNGLLQNCDRNQKLADHTTLRIVKSLEILHMRGVVTHSLQTLLKEVHMNSPNAIAEHLQHTHTGSKLSGLSSCEVTASLKDVCRLTSTAAFFGNCGNDVTFIQPGIVALAIGALAEFQASWLKLLSKKTFSKSRYCRIKAIQNKLVYFCETGVLQLSHMFGVFTMYRAKWLLDVKKLRPKTIRLDSFISKQLRLLDILIELDHLQLANALQKLRLLCPLSFSSKKSCSSTSDLARQHIASSTQSIDGDLNSVTCELSNLGIFTSKYNNDMSIANNKCSDMLQEKAINGRYCFLPRIRPFPSSQMEKLWSLTGESCMQVAGRVFRMNTLPASLMASLFHMCTSRYSRVHGWRTGMLLQLSECESLSTWPLILVYSSFDVDADTHLPYSICMIACTRHQDSIRGSNSLVSCQLPVVACLEHLLIYEHPGVVWTVSASCPNCLHTRNLIPLDILISYPFPTQFQLATLENLAYVDCTTCNTSILTPVLLLNFTLLEENDTGTELEMRRVQNAISGLGRVVAQPYKGLQASEQSNDANADDWELLYLPKNEAIDFRSPLNSIFD